MTLLQRYFRTQAFWPLLLSLTALAVIAIIMPLSVFMAVLYALNRLHGDSELVVAKASGASPWQISSPIMRLGVFALIVHLIINLFVQPSSFRQMRAEVLKVRTDIASRMIQEGQFVTPTPGLTLYAREIGVDGKLKDILIYDSRDDSGPTTHTAKKGEVIRQDGLFLLSLQNGSDAVAVDTTLRLKTSDRYLHELLRPNPLELINKKIRNEHIAEGHARLSSPLYNLALVCLALSFMLRGEHLRMGYGKRIALCAFVGFFIRLSGFALTSASESNIALNWLQYALPLLVILICLIYLTRPNRRRRRGLKKRQAAYDAGLQKTVQKALLS